LDGAVGRVGVAGPERDDVFVETHRKLGAAHLGVPRGGTHRQNRNRQRLTRWFCK
jgi:hypothetical protein